MPIYETVFIARQDLSDAQVKDITDSCEKIITDAKGKILKTENWGLRTLAYRINKNRKGHYVLIESDTAPEAIIEIERVMRLDENILRCMSIKLEEATEGPSKMMEKSDDRSDSRSDNRPEKKEAA